MIKEQERAELHRAIWQIANDLRGSVDGWDFKQYVLGMLFYSTKRRQLYFATLKVRPRGLTARLNLSAGGTKTNYFARRLIKLWRVWREAGNERRAKK